MPIVELSKPVGLSDLVVGNVFDDVELIIEKEADNFTTITKQGGIEGGKEYDIRMYFYNITNKNREIIINNNGYGEIYDDDEFFLEYKEKLEKAGLYEE